MEFRSVFDPSFRAYGRLVPGCDTGALEAALLAHPQPAEGVLYESRPAGVALRRAAEALGAQLFPGERCRYGIYSGKLASPRRLLRQRRGTWLIGAYDFLLPVSAREDVRRRWLRTEQVTAFYVPAGVLVELYGSTLHCVPCHTHDRDGLSVLMLCPAGPLQRTADRGREVLAEKLPGRRSPVRVRRLRPVRVTLNPKPPAGAEEAAARSPISRETLRQLCRAAAPRRLYGKARWKVHVAARLKEPPSDL